MSKQTALLAERLERRRHVALRQSSRGQEHLVEFERSDELYLVIRDRASHRSFMQTLKHTPPLALSNYQAYYKQTSNEGQRRKED
ncbi:hypothetical protein K2P47_02225 [Patescibacteria group bacterium]|nr:hypothetical protein [Patescibacteria group bacterium]